MDRESQISNPKSQIPSGRIVQVKGAVVDVAFPPEQLPEVHTALEVPVDGRKLVLEVAS